MCCVTKATSILFINGNCHVKELKSFNQLHMVYITPYHATASKTLTADTYTHANVQTRAISRNWACTWFNNAL